MRQVRATGPLCVSWLCATMFGCHASPAANSGAPASGGAAGLASAPRGAAPPASAAPNGGTMSASAAVRASAGTLANAGATASASHAAPPGAAPVDNHSSSKEDDAGTNLGPSAGPQEDDERLSSPEWLSYGHDLSNTRHNPGETQIGVDNVSQLQLKWSWTTAAVTSTPAYRDGTLYFADWKGGVVALDEATGRERWRSLDPGALVGMITASAYVEQDALYIGGNTSLWYRVNRSTGAIVWSKNVNEGSSANTLSSLARVGDLLIGGVASFQNINPIDGLIGAKPFRGSVVALDAASGQKKWEFFTTTGQGVGVSSSAAIDPVRKRLFIGTGQNYDATDSPYADSLLALDYETGSYAWHAQYNTGDSWGLGHMDRGDLDVLSTPVLYTAGELAMVAAGDKGGSFRAFDRDGHPQWKQQLAPGGHHGGVMGSPAYYNGTLYVCSGDFTTDNGETDGQSGPMSSSLFALDGRTGDVRWRAPIDGTCYGAITHANGLVYLPGGNGNIRAFDDRDGRMLWSAALGESSAGGVTVAHGMVFVSYGWSWSDLGTPGGVKAFGLPNP